MPLSVAAGASRYQLGMRPGRDATDCGEMLGVLGVEAGPPAHPFSKSAAAVNAIVA